MPDAFARTSAADPLRGLRAHVPTGDDIHVRIHELPDTSQIQLITRNNNAGRLEDRLKRFLGRKSALEPMEGVVWNKLFICATGPLEHWLLIDGHAASSEVTSLIEAVGDSASVFDQTSGRSTFRFTGEKVTNVLAKGTALNLEAPDLPAQYATHTALGHVPVLISRRTEPDCYDVSVPRSFTASFVEWLTDALREFGHTSEEALPCS